MVSCTVLFDGGPKLWATVKALLRRVEFDSVDHLADRVIAFIRDYNRRAAPFRWTYDGRPLRAA